MPALASKDRERALDCPANPNGVLLLNISEFIVTIRNVSSTRYGLTHELGSTFNQHQSPTPYSQISTLAVPRHPTTLFANAGSLFEPLAARILERSEIYGVSVFIGVIDVADRPRFGYYSLARTGSAGQAPGAKVAR
jgi:hypothetical protein